MKTNKLLAEDSQEDLNLIRANSVRYLWIRSALLNASNGNAEMLAKAFKQFSETPSADEIDKAIDKVIW
jgi:hypothetical protein